MRKFFTPIYYGITALFLKYGDSSDVVWVFLSVAGSTYYTIETIKHLLDYRLYKIRKFVHGKTKHNGYI